MKTRHYLTLKLALLFMATQSQAVQATEVALDKFLLQKTKVVHEVNRRARKALTQTLKNKAFEQYFSAEDDSSRNRAVVKIEKAILKTQKLFDVEEMCLIDRSGAELARVDGGHLSHELAQDEHEAVFFEPGFKLREGGSLISPIYFSPDSHSWVVAYVSPVYHEGEAKALLHYEHDLNYLQKKIIDGVEGDRFIVALSNDGWLIADSRDPVEFKAQDSHGEPEPAAFFSREIFPGTSGDQVLAAAGSELLINGFSVEAKTVGKLTLIAFEQGS